MDTNDFYEILKERMTHGTMQFSVSGDRGQGKSSVALQMGALILPQYKRIRVVWK